MTKVEVEGSGVNLELKAVGRRDELVAALAERRRGPAPAAAPSAPADPVEMLSKLAALRDAGVLSEEEFSAKNADLLRRM